MLLESPPLRDPIGAFRFRYLTAVIAETGMQLPEKSDGKMESATYPPATSERQ